MFVCEHYSVCVCVYTHHKKTKKMMHVAQEKRKFTSFFFCTQPLVLKYTWVITIAYNIHNVMHVVLKGEKNERKAKVWVERTAKFLTLDQN